ncbi:MAG: Gfo/Idh/MocA family oxidoreductase [Candidatus Tectomicrobia bacterium]|nr:Gfo/Idh/MocA family oxidoreductase [Candidatus Tectomicrobia bacterium]
MSIRVAAIGMSHWHSLYDAAYLRHLSEMPDVQIVGIHDERGEIATHRANELGGAIPTFTDYRQMLSEVRPDFILALGRHDIMAEIAHYLLDNRIPFVMEKPMSYNARQLRSVVEKADAMNGFAAVPLGQRYSPLMHYAKKFAEEGTYGPLGHFYARMNRPTSARYPAWGSSWMLDPKISNGGCLRNLGPHGLDCFVYLTGEGEEIEVTGAQLSWATHRQPVEDYASVLIKSKKGILGTVEVGNGFPRDGTDGQVKVAFRDAILISTGGVIKLETSEGEQTLPLPDSPRGSVLRQTIEAAMRGDKPPVSAHDCYRAVRLIDLAYLAAGNPYGTAAV